jgi:hypothetical protein
MSPHSQQPRQVLLQNPLLEQELELFQQLTEEQKRNFNHWKDRLSKKNAWKAMLSRQYRNGEIKITKGEARENDKKFSQVVDRYMGWEIEDFRRKLCYKPANPGNRKRLVKIGAGTGLGLGYCSEALIHMDLEIYDWQASAEKKLEATILEFGLDERKIFHIREGSQVCQTLDTAVGILEMIRVDEHMSDEDAALMYQGAGQILLDPENKVITCRAVKSDHNDKVGTETCHHRDKDFALYNLRIGAKNRPVREYRYLVFSDIEKEFRLSTYCVEF